MTRILLLSVALLAAPMAALALPAVGDIVGTNPDDATAALKAAGCDVTAFEAEGGKIDARCTDAATGDVLEVSIDPKTGAVLDLKKETDAMASPSVKLVELWDPVVRLTHWSIAVIVLLNAVLTEGDSLLHIWAGWVGMAILAMRLLWGLIGTPEARFVAFPPNPRAALSHLANLVAGRPDHYPSHNPAGAAMAYALWGTLGLLMLTGLVMTGGDTPMQIADQRAAVAAGDWSVLVPAGDSSDNGGDNGGGETGDSKAGTWAETAKEVHGLAGNLIIFLALMHVAGVVFESRAMRRNLVKPMLFGQDK